MPRGVARHLDAARAYRVPALSSQRILDSLSTGTLSGIVVHPANGRQCDGLELRLLVTIADPKVLRLTSGEGCHKHGVGYQRLAFSCRQGEEVIRFGEVEEGHATVLGWAQFNTDPYWFAFGDGLGSVQHRPILVCFWGWDGVNSTSTRMLLGMGSIQHRPVLVCFWD